MDHSRLRRLRFIFLAAIAGCSGAAPAPGEMKAPADGEAFCWKLAALVSSKENCYPASKIAIAKELDADASCARIAAALTAGRIRYDQEQATACLNAVAAMPCATGYTYEQVHLACAAALPGQAQTGQSCNRLWRAARLSDCAEGNFCNTIGVCPGVCQRFGDVNESCDNLHPCRLDLLCGTADAKCHPRPVAGGSCVILDPQLVVLPELTGVSPCPGHQYYCSRATLTCKPTLPDGQACTPGEGGCRGYCATGSLSTPGKCVPVGGPGASCTGDRTAAVRSIDGQLSLSQALPCGFGLGCSEGVCRDGPAVGEECDASVNPCATGVCGPDMVCQAPPPRANADCFPGTVCGRSGEACCGPVVVSLGPPYVSAGCASGAACGASGLCP